MQLELCLLPVGRSVPLVNQRRNYFLPEAILAEVQLALAAHRPGEIDWITFVGSGEPTLHASIGLLIRQVKTLTEIPIAILTEWLPAVQAGSPPGSRCRRCRVTNARRRHTGIVSPCEPAISRVHRRSCGCSSPDKDGLRRAMAILGDIAAGGSFCSGFVRFSG